MVHSVGLLGGMFDPVHLGHLSIAEAYLKSEIINELWVIPSFSPPHKRNTAVTDFEHRVAMLQRAFATMPGVVIRDIERSLPSPNYTIQTLEALRKQYPDTKFYWCIGSDNLHSLNTWFNYEHILEGWKLLVATRPDFETSRIPESIRSRCLFVENKPRNISSTSVRFALYNTGVSADIPKAVLDYIREFKLYQSS
ncbi:MAG: nicotinate-nucleotide adenylyltransferase NadD [Bacteroidetes bacterium HLUCCA01]|nr:MAG: nicotinate-nucleotide adenylyltransferase NadD [Bacteroidetes bacterium HLUCCA01]